MTLHRLVLQNVIGCVTSFIEFAELYAYIGCVSA